MRLRIVQDYFLAELFSVVSFFDTIIIPQGDETIETLSNLYFVLTALGNVEKTFLKDPIVSNQHASTINKYIDSI